MAGDWGLGLSGWLDRMKLIENKKSSGDVMKALQTTAKRCRAGLSVALATEEASEFSGQARDLTQAGWSRRQRLIGSLVGEQRLPLVLLKGNGTRRLWCFAGQLLDVLDAPRHHQINGQALLPNRAVTELTVFNAATALEGSVILLDAPALLVPVDLFQRLLEIVDLQGRQQHPLNGVLWRSRIDLGDVDRPKTKRPQRALALGGTQLHLCKANVEHRSACCFPLAFGNVEQTLARHRLAFHILPQTLTAVLHSPITLGSDQELGVGRITFRQQKQLVDIGLAVPHTDHRTGRSNLALQ